MYQVRLEQFQGPLDLLLYFIRRDEIDIYDIPIAAITAEYLDAIEALPTTSLALAGDFIHMAATLMRIKAQMLLPRPQLEEEEAFPDPRTQLVQRLLEYQRFKAAARGLGGLTAERQHYYNRHLAEAVPPGGEDPQVYLKQVSLFDLATYFKEVLERKPVISPYELHREPVHLDDQKALILRSLDGEGVVTFGTLVAALATKLEVIVTFLALLDLMRTHQVTVFQNTLFDELEIHLLKKA